MKKYRKYSILLIPGSIILIVIFGFVYQKWNQPDEKKIIVTLEENKIEKIVCTNAYFPREKNVILTDSESIKILCEEFQKVTFQYVPKPIKDKLSEMKEKVEEKIKGMTVGGYCQLLKFYKEEDSILLTIEIESDTELFLYRNGYTYRCTLLQDSELSKRISDMVEEYWD